MFIFHNISLFSIPAINVSTSALSSLTSGSLPSNAQLLMGAEPGVTRVEPGAHVVFMMYIPFKGKNKMKIGYKTSDLVPVWLSFVHFIQFNVMNYLLSPKM